MFMGVFQHEGRTQYYTLSGGLKIEFEIYVLTRIGIPFFYFPIEEIVRAPDPHFSNKVANASKVFFIMNSPLYDAYNKNSERCQTPSGEHFLQD